MDQLSSINESKSLIQYPLLWRKENKKLKNFTIIFFIEKKKMIFKFTLSVIILDLSKMICEREHVAQNVIWYPNTCILDTDLK